MENIHYLIVAMVGADIDELWEFHWREHNKLSWLNSTKRMWKNMIFDTMLLLISCKRQIPTYTIDSRVNLECKVQICNKIFKNNCYKVRYREINLRVIMLACYTISFLSVVYRSCCYENVPVWTGAFEFVYGRYS